MAFFGGARKHSFILSVARLNPQANSRSARLIHFDDRTKSRALTKLNNSTAMNSIIYTVVIAPKRIAATSLLCLAAFLASINLSCAATNETVRLVSADLRQTNGPLNTMFKFCVGAGRANEGLRADWQRQLAYAHRECGFQYIRMHGLFCDDMGVYREDHSGNPEYNWQYIDELYDFLQSIGMKPFVELGFMPDGLSSGSKTIFWWHGNVTPPKDMKKWADFVYAFVLHVKERYGDTEVRTWYFEVWNEPNLTDGFWTGTQQQYFDLYAATARAIKSVSPDYKVGGPATAGCGWVPEFIHFCDTNHTPVDFIATHTYGVESGYLDETATHGTALSHNPTSIFGEVKWVRQMIADSAFPKLELHFTEWSSSYTPADPFHDSYHSAAYILDKLKMRRCPAIHVLLDVHGYFRRIRPALGGLSRRLRPDQLREHQQAGVLRVSILEPAWPDGIEGQRPVLMDLRGQLWRRAVVGLGFYQHLPWHEHDQSGLLQTRFAGEAKKQNQTLAVKPAQGKIHR
jgi:hypothetical protein